MATTHETASSTCGTGLLSGSRSYYRTIMSCSTQSPQQGPGRFLAVAAE